MTSNGQSDAARPPRRAINCEHIADESIASTIREVAALRDELQELRKQSRDKRAELRGAVAKGKEARPQGSSAKIDALEATRKKLDKEAVVLRDQIAAVRDEMDLLRLTEFGAGRDGLEASVAKLEGEVKDAVDAHSAHRRKMPYATMSDADAAIAKLRKQVEASQGKSTQVASLTKQIAVAEQAKKEVDRSYSLEKAIYDRKQRLEKLRDDAEKQKRILASLGAKTAKEARETLSAKLTKLKDSQKAKRKECDDHFNELQRVRKEARSQEHAAAETESADQLREDVKALDDAITTKSARLKTIEDDGFPTAVVDVPAEVRGDIVGPGGANVQQMQLDFGVAIDIAGGKATIIGGADAVEAAEEAMRGAVAAAVDSRQSETIAVPPTLMPALIGSQGANVAELQTVSGARITVDRKEGVARLTGDTQALAKARALIEEFLDSNAEEVLGFDPAFINFVYGPSGSRVKQLEAEHKLKKLRVDKAKSVIIIVGSRPAVNAVKAVYNDLLASLSVGVVTVEPRSLRLVIGPSGATIRDIQERSGATVDAQQSGAVRLVGSKDAVQAARQMVMDVVRRDEVKVPVNPALFDALTDRPFVTPEPLPDGTRQQGEERNSTLEEIKAITQCDQVSVIHREGVVVLRGRREAVNEARRMVDEEVRKLTPAQEEVVLPEFALAYFRAKGQDKKTPVDRIKDANPGVQGMRLTFATKTVSIAGGVAPVAAAKAAISERVDWMEKHGARLEVPTYAVGGVIGSQGSNVRRLQEDYGVLIDVSRGDGKSVVRVVPPPREADDEEECDEEVELVDGVPECAPASVRAAALDIMETVQRE